MKISINQEKLQVNKNQKKNKHSFGKEVDYLFDYVNKKNKESRIHVFNLIVGYTNNLPNGVKLSQAAIGKALGLCREQVNRIVKDLEKLNWIFTDNNTDKTKKTKANPKGQTINTYRLNPIFFDMNIRNAISSFIPNAKYLPIALLVFSFSNLIYGKYNFFDKENTLPCDKKNVTQEYYNIVYKTKLSSSRVHARAYARGDLASEHLKNLEIDETLKEKLAINDLSVLYDNTFFRKRILSAGKLLNMTFAGMCSASKFPDHVIDRALKEIRFYKKAIRKAYGVFVTKCNDICKTQNIPINHSDPYKMAEVCGINLKDSPSTLEGVPEILAYKKSSAPHSRFYDRKQSAQKTFSLEELKKKNPEMIILEAEHVSPWTYRIRHHYDDHYRQTTIEEREEWSKRMRESLVFFSPFSMPTIPEAPTHFMGNPNIPSHKMYHTDSTGVLHLHNPMNIYCNLCNKKAGKSNV